MKWSEFKKVVDDRLDELGIEDPGVCYFDINADITAEDIEIEMDKLIVSN